VVWNHGVPPSHGVIQGALYPVFGGRELAVGGVSNVDIDGNNTL